MHVPENEDAVNRLYYVVKDESEWVFFDDQEGSEGYGQSVATCSGCGERLHRGMLTPA